MLKNITTKIIGFIKKEWFRLSGLLIILVVICLVFVYINNQNTIASNERMEKIRLEKDASNKEYIAKRRNDCFDIYDKEKGNWNNVTGNRYDEDKDICYVVYKDNTNTKTQKQCFADWSDESGKFYTYPGASQEYLLCVNHSFEKEF